MIKINAVLRCSRISLARFFGSKRSLIVLGVSLVFSGYIYIPLTKMTGIFREKIPPAAIVFYLSNIIMIILQAGMAVYIFFDIMITDSFSMWIMQRSGRVNYALGQIMYLFILSFVYVMTLYVLSVLLTSPVLGLSGSWGKIFYSLAETPELMMQKTGIELIYPVSRTILNRFSPGEAVLLSLMFLWLDTVFTGVVIMFFSVVFDLIGGFTAAGVLAAMPVFSLYAGAISIGPWLQYASPLSWSYIGQMDWFRSGTYPSPEYAVVFLISGILIMGTGTVFAFKRKDFE